MNIILIKILPIEYNNLTCDCQNIEELKLSNFINLLSYTEVFVENIK